MEMKASATMSITRKKVFRFFSESLAKSPAPKPVADVVLKIINEKNPKYNYPVGARLPGYFRPCNFSRITCSRLVF